MRYPRFIVLLLLGSLLFSIGEGLRATFMSYAFYNPENREALEKAFREEIDKARNEGCTAEELAAAKSG